MYGGKRNMNYQLQFFLDMFRILKIKCKKKVVQERKTMFCNIYIRYTLMLVCNNMVEIARGSKKFFEKKGIRNVCHFIVQQEKKKT